MWFDVISVFVYKDFTSADFPVVSRPKYADKCTQTNVSNEFDTWSEQNSRLNTGLPWYLKTLEKIWIQFWMILCPGWGRKWGLNCTWRASCCFRWSWPTWKGGGASDETIRTWPDWLASFPPFLVYNGAGRPVIPAGGLNQNIETDCTTKHGGYLIFLFFFLMFCQ